MCGMDKKNHAQVCLPLHCIMLLFFLKKTLNFKIQTCLYLLLFRGVEAYYDTIQMVLSVTKLLDEAG